MFQLCQQYLFSGQGSFERGPTIFKVSTLSDETRIVVSNDFEKCNINLAGDPDKVLKHSIITIQQSIDMTSSYVLYPFNCIILLIVITQRNLLLTFGSSD